MYRHLNSLLPTLKAREKFMKQHESEEDYLTAREHRIEIEERMREMREGNNRWNS
jgi:hypothetical protein